MASRIIQVVILTASYALLITAASAQDIDPSTNIGNQVDQNVIDTLTAPGSTPVNLPPPSKGEKPLDLLNFDIKTLSTVVTQDGKLSPYSGYSTTVKPVSVAILAQQGFTSKDSFVGMGVMTTYMSQVGLDFATCFGTDIQPFLNYQHASRDLIGTTTYRSDSYGGSINIVQRLFPFVAITDRQRKAVYNFQADDTSVKDVNGTPQPLSDGNSIVVDKKTGLPVMYVKDVYPNCDGNLGVSLGMNAPDISTFKKSKWIDSNQNMYSVAPSAIFDLFFRPVVDDGVPRPCYVGYLPNSISFVATYNDTLAMADDGTSSSNGTLSFQERNTYAFALGHPTGLPLAKNKKDFTDVVPHPNETIQLIETNTLLHDTNQEPLTPPSGPLPYQNWAKFGLAIAYTNTKAKLNVKLEYTYEAFNALYDSQNVVASVSYQF